MTNFFYAFFVFNLVLLVTVTGQSTCVKIGCADTNLADNSGTMVGQSCLNGTTMYTCNTYDKEYCHLLSSSPLSGECRSNATRFQYFPVRISFPGERCDPQRALYECGHGYRSCSAFRCLGFLQNERCAMSEDWNPGLYWDSSVGTCQPIKSVGTACTISPEWGRTAACIYASASAVTGTCTEYFSIEDNNNIYAKNEEDTFVCKSGFGHYTYASGIYEYKTGSNFDAGIYTCGKKLSSHNAGNTCTSGYNCATNEGHIYAQCACSYGSDRGICGILPGNTEWQDYFGAVKEYYSSTKDCHNARNFEGVWDQEELNDQKNCLKAKAKHFIVYNEAPEWVKLYSNNFLYPEVNEIEEWCNPDRK